MRDTVDETKMDSGKGHRWMLPGMVALIVIVAVLIFFVYFHVDTIQVMGSSYYTEDEIKEMVLKGPLASNSILAPPLYSKKNVEDIPFIEAISVSRTNNHTILISVKEVESVGCFKYLDCYMYFDREGIIVASSVERDMRVPFFQGIAIESVAYGEEVPFADDSLLNTCVTLARIFSKNNVIPDYIDYDSGGNIVLTYGGVRAQLGQDRYLEDKMTRMIAILPQIKNETGILHLENVTDTKKVITFEKELTEEEKLAQQNAADGSEEGTVADSGEEGEDSSYSSGEDSSYSSGEDSSYSSGEDSGYSSGEDSDYNSGEDSGYSSGEDSAYDSGDY